MNFEIEDYIDFHVLFVTMCIVIAYRYITDEQDIIVERKIDEGHNRVYGNNRLGTAASKGRIIPLDHSGTN